MINRQRRILFIHIPKCAGTFIEHHMTPGIDWNEDGKKHLHLRDAIREYRVRPEDRYYIFSIVRNPFSRMVSFYLFHRRKRFSMLEDGGGNSILRRIGRRLRLTERYYRSFPAFIDFLFDPPSDFAQWARNDIAPAVDFLEGTGGIEVADVFRLEEIDEWLPTLAEKTQTDFGRERMNQAPVAYDPMAFYTPATLDTVREFYQGDFERFYPALL